MLGDAAAGFLLVAQGVNAALESAVVLGEEVISQFTDSANTESGIANKVASIGRRL